MHHLRAALTAGTRQANRIRHRYLAAVLRQDVSFFDEKASGGLMQGLNEDIVAIQNASPLLLNKFTASAPPWLRPVPLTWQQHQRHHPCRLHGLLDTYALCSQCSDLP